MNGLLPPQAIELEEVIIGSLLMDKGIYLVLADKLTRESFYKERHAVIWDAVEDNFTHGRPTDLVSIMSYLRRSGSLESIGGIMELTRLTEKVASTANVEHSAAIIQQMWMLREIISKSAEVAKKAYNAASDPFDLMSELTGHMDAISEKIEKSQDISVKRQLGNTILDIEEAHRKGGVIGKSTGFRELDKAGTLENGEFIILAARPGQAKSALLMQIGMNIATSDKEPILVFHLEMRYQQVWKRELSRLSMIHHDKIRKGNLTESEWRKINENVSHISGLPVYLYDNFSQSISYMRRKCMQVMNKHGKIGMIGVDFIQLADPQNPKRNSSREEDIGIISRGLKGMTKEFDCPVIAISSLNREAEKRANKVPDLSDLRGSGSLESDADRVMLLYRPEYYGITHDEYGNSTEGKAIILHPKSRNGERGETVLYFNGPTVSFHDSRDLFNSIEYSSPNW